MNPLDVFIARWTAAGVSLDFIDTVNTQVDTATLADKWGSAVQQSETRADVTLGSTPYVEERGVIVVGLFARAGTGHAVLNAEIEEVRAAFHGYFLKQGGEEIYFTSVDGPLDVDPETEGEWWRVALSVPYALQSRRAEPPA